MLENLPGNEIFCGFLKVNLVERNHTPFGVSLVSASRVGKHDTSDIVALAREISTADEALKHRATGKLSVILEQVSTRAGDTEDVGYYIIILGYTDKIPAAASGSDHQRN